MTERLDAVLAVIYLVFNEGYSAAAGDAPVRGELCREAIRLGRCCANFSPPSTRRRAVSLLASPWACLR
jgi:RNA polymerase sigma-70 factor (ECF subfamily)